MQLLLGHLLEHGSAEKEIYSVFRDPYAYTGYITFVSAYTVQECV